MHENAIQKDKDHSQKLHFEKQIEKLNAELEEVRRGKQSV